MSLMSRSTTASSSSRLEFLDKPVFFHYMIGTATEAHCEQDIQDALALGSTGFALNIHDVVSSWSLNTTAWLFHYANKYGYKLFFSFDMSWFQHPKEFTTFLMGYVCNNAYYRHKDRPFVSTFNGGAKKFNFGEADVNEGWKVHFQQVMANAGYPVYFIPALQDVSITDSFFETFPTLDGAMNWDSWPFVSEGKVAVSVNLDKTMHRAARSVNKTFMMGLSPIQYKHIDENNNFYRRGEQNLEHRFAQVLDLQPDFLQIQSWNDAGEGHYMGNIWPEGIAGTPIPDYTEDYDHTAYCQILPAFIKAWRAGEKTTANMCPTNGQVAQGCFWHHTLLKESVCPADALGRPSGIHVVEDTVTVVVLIAAGERRLSAVVLNGRRLLGRHRLLPGYNTLSFSGMATGPVTVTIQDNADTMLFSGRGPISVTSSASLYNFNFQVVALDRLYTR